ncbi:MAG: hypothetical protein F6K58_28875 [Symploca sp. SIO2E9]|nr:hypothetical protein [Symploca sp. SIO2E9]
MQESILTIFTFLKLLEVTPSLISAEDLADLPQLDQTIAKFSANQLEAVAEEIRIWLSRHPQVIAEYPTLQALQRKELDDPPPRNRQQESRIIPNFYIEEPLPNSNSEAMIVSEAQSGTSPPQKIPLLDFLRQTIKKNIKRLP